MKKRFRRMPRGKFKYGCFSSEEVKGCEILVYTYFPYLEYSLVLRFDEDIIVSETETFISKSDYFDNFKDYFDSYTKFHIALKLMKLDLNKIRDLHQTWSQSKK